MSSTHLSIIIVAISIILIIFCCGCWITCVVLIVSKRDSRNRLQSLVPKAMVRNGEELAMCEINRVKSNTFANTNVRRNLHDSAINKEENEDEDDSMYDQTNVIKEKETQNGDIDNNLLPALPQSRRNSINVDKLQLTNTETNGEMDASLYQYKNIPDSFANSVGTGRIILENVDATVLAKMLMNINDNNGSCGTDS